MDMNADFKLSAYAFLVYGVISLSNFAVFYFMSGELKTFNSLPLFLHAYINLMLVIDFLAFLTGYYLLQGNANAHRFAFPLSFILLVNLPFGTAVGALYLYQRSKSK